MNVIEEASVIGEFQQQNAHAEEVSDNEEEEEDEDPTRHNLENEMDNEFIPDDVNSTSTSSENEDGDGDGSLETTSDAAMTAANPAMVDFNNDGHPLMADHHGDQMMFNKQVNAYNDGYIHGPPQPPPPPMPQQQSHQYQIENDQLSFAPPMPLQPPMATMNAPDYNERPPHMFDVGNGDEQGVMYVGANHPHEIIAQHYHHQPPQNQDNMMNENYGAGQSTPVTTHVKPMMTSKQFISEPYSTPSNNQIPPLNVHGTLIPSIPEENFHRKRGTDESASPKYQYQQQQQQNQQELLNTQTINMENSEANSPQSPRVVGITNNYIKQHQNGAMIHQKFNPGLGYAAAAARGNQIIDDDRMPVDMSLLKDDERRDLIEFEREQKEQDQFFDIEKYYQPSNGEMNTQLYRQYMQLGILYKARGSKLEQVSNAYTAFKEETEKDIRVLKHQVTLAQEEQSKAEIMCAQLTENERRFKEKLNMMTEQQRKDSEIIAKLNFEKQELQDQFNHLNMEIDGLHGQIQEMQRSELVDTERQRFESFAQQMRDQYEAQIHELRQKISTIEIESSNKEHTLKELSDSTAKTSEEYRKLMVDHADIQGKYSKAFVEVNRLNGLLNELQSDNQKYREEIDGLRQKCDELESEKTSDSTATMTTSKTVSTIQKEFDAVTKSFREKKSEVHQKQVEINRLLAQIEELGKEKAEQQEELTNLRERCDKALSECESLQNEKADLEEKQQQLTQHIEALENQLQRSNNYEMNVAMVQQSEQLKQELFEAKSQLAEYKDELGNTKCALDNCQREVIKTKELYLAVCEEKYNLEDNLREKAKKELEAQFDKRLQVSVEAANEEIRVEFDLELKKKIAEIESLKETTKLEKSKFQQTLHSTETQYKSRVSELQRTLEEKEAQLNEQLNQLQIQLEEKENKLNQLQKELETEKSTSRTTESELKEKLESAQRSVEQLTTDCERLRGEIESTEKRCQNLQVDCNRLQNSLNEEREKTGKIESELREVREGETNRSTDELSRLKEDRDRLERLLGVKESEIGEERAKLTQLEQRLIRYKDESELHEKKLIEEFEMAKKRWQLEKNQLIEKSENDLRVTVDQLENRFNEDYARFMEAHKVKFNDGLMQKNEEFRVEKEKIMEMYQEKFGQYEREQQELFKQIKELKDQLKEAKEFNEKLRKESERLQKEANDKFAAIREEHEKEVNELRREKENAARERQEELDANENDRKDSESIEVLYKKKVDDMEAKYEVHINEIQNKFDSDLQRSKTELNDHYKQILTKSKSDIEQLQKVVKSLQDKLRDSNSVNDTLKVEMKRMKEAHLNELTQLAMKSERDRQSLVEQTEEAVRRVQALKRQLDECDEEYRKQSEIMKAELKADYSYELSKMNKKMNDMMSSHQSAVEILNRQHAERLRKSTSLFNTSVLTIDVSSQTEMVMKDLQKIESFKKNYLENMNIIKGDMLKELDDQTRRFTSRLRRQKNEDRLLIRKKILETFMPKIVALFKEYSIPNLLIEAKITDLKSDLELITAPDDTDTPKPSSSSSRRIQSSQTTSNPNNRAHFSSSLGRLTESVESTEPATTTTRTHHRYDDQLSSSTTKRSASVLGSVIRPNLAKSDDFSISNSAANLHSKSASNMVDLDAILSPRSSSKGERRGEDVMAPMSARSRGNIDQVLSSLASSTSTSYSTLNRLKSPLTVATNTVQPVEAYKCSPLRQSWNNLALLSPTFNNSANIDTNHNERRGISEEDDDGSQTSRSIASVTKINRFVSTGRSRASQTKPVDLEQPTDEEERTSKASDREDDYIYVDEDENDAANFNKYRAQNIRKKKNSQPKQSSVSDLINSNRAATNLVRTSSNFIPFSSSSTSSTIGNPNGQSVTKIVQRSNTTATGPTVAKKTSSGLLGGGVSTNGGLGYNSANDTESDDTPTRLAGASSDSSEPESMAGRLAKNRSATTTTVSSQTSSNTNNQSKTSANNSLSRERTTSTVSSTNSLSKQQQYTSTSSQELPIYSSLSFSSISPAPSFMSATKASMQRTVSNSGSKISNGSSIFSTSSYSTQYHPISSTAAAAASSIVKQSIFQKKKNAFH